MHYVWHVYKRVTFAEYESALLTYVLVRVWYIYEDYEAILLAVEL